ncbi:alpha/beta hydrolase domain-containing protein [Niveispirillum sp. BGYR6]|uniref:alpha/beta hydrolase domain-containing protein n=1 Tax=Niveispirillum sp. BGYR6 TaxID=2971249 RepID=UPI0022B97796|nr:alpha/beta hydrolase domain-containing protein [Niveispirillum sp. BGYR6]MDG5493865.1 alpha/beta hydrolase domain-containing protein [Niveispirillum sp. BGYR6]
MGAVTQNWRRAGLAILFLLVGGTAAARAEVPSLPTILPVPPSDQPPLSSALRETNPGTEYLDLASVGYTEAEYYLSGTAPAITAQGAVLFQAPYITRILVRRPTDPAKFNGTVVIEPFTWIGERGAGWILTRDYLVRRGYAWVGYTLNINKPAADPKTTTDPAWTPDPEPQNLNFDFMRRFDYARYAPLGSYYDPARFRRGDHADPFVPQSQGIGAQLALALKSNLTDGPLAGLRVQRVYVNSWAVTAQVWMDYLDQGRHQQWRLPDGGPLIDAYMTGRMSFGEVGGDAIRIPRQMPDTAPFVTIYSQSEAMHDALEGIALPPDSDTPRLRYYEVTGMSHLRLADLGTQEVEDMPADVGKENDPNCQHFYDEPAEMVVSALFDAMDHWVRTGQPMPKVQRLTRAGAGIARDARTGNMLGGVRPPWVTVPAAAYLTDQETGCGLVFDTKRPYPRATLKALYGDFASYERRFQAATQAAVRQGFLLPEDAARLRPAASPADFQAGGRP